MTMVRREGVFDKYGVRGGGLSNKAPYIYGGLLGYFKLYCIKNFCLFVVIMHPKIKPN